MLEGQAWMLPKEFLERLSLMGGGIIQQHDDRAAQVPQQLPQKHTDLFLGDVVKGKQIVEAQTMSLGAQRNSGNDGDLVPAPLTMTLDGSATPGRPSFGHQGSQPKARFVGKN